MCVGDHMIKSWSTTQSVIALSTGEAEVYDNSNTMFEEVANACTCSASIPGVFSPQQFKGNYLMDGGTITNMNLDTALAQCKAVVKDGDMTRVTVDVALCGHHEMPKEKKTGNTIKNFFRLR